MSISTMLESKVNLEKPKTPSIKINTPIRNRYQNNKMLVGGNSLLNYLKEEP